MGLSAIRLSGECMLKQINKLVTGFLILVVIVAAITSFRESLLNNGASYDAFVAVFDCFPFAKEMAEVAANIGQYGITLQGLSPSNFLDDIAKIFAMSIVCPILIGAASALFLKVPNYRDWYDREQYMRGDWLSSQEMSAQRDYDARMRIYHGISDGSTSAMAPV